jgi:transposase-like protein
MTTDNTTPVDETTLFLGEAWSDPIEAGIRDRIRSFIEALIEEELAVALGRGRYERRHRRGDGEAGSFDGPPAVQTGDVAPGAGHRHGHRERRLTGSFGTVEIAVPRARIGGADGGPAEWKSKALPRYTRMTKQVEALIAGTYLAGTSTRRVPRALAALFRGAIGKDTVSRIWRKVKTDWEAGSKRPLDTERHRTVDPRRHRRALCLDRKATSISLLVILDVHRDGREVLLAVKNMGGGRAAWPGAGPALL